MIPGSVAGTTRGGAEVIILYTTDIMQAVTAVHATIHVELTANADMEPTTLTLQETHTTETEMVSILITTEALETIVHGTTATTDRLIITIVIHLITEVSAAVVHTAEVSAVVVQVEVVVRTVDLVVVDKAMIN